MTSMLRRVKSRKGFTLTELIVVVAIVALLMICVTAFVGPINTMVKNTTADADAITINEIAGDYIERRLAYADCIQIYLGANADTTNYGPLSNAYTAIQGYRGTNDTTGMLVFKLVENTSDATENTYRLYDVPIKATGTSYISSYESSTGTILPKNPVFTDDYYGRYKHLFLLNPDGYNNGNFTVAVNIVKGKAYLNFDIYSYDFGENTAAHIEAKGGSDSTLEQFYQHIEDPLLNPNDGISDLLLDRTAYEHVSFELQNIGIATVTETETINGITVNKEVGKPKLVNVEYVGGGDDIVIFYNVKDYTPATLISPP